VLTEEHSLVIGTVQMMIRFQVMLSWVYQKQVFIVQQHYQHIWSVWWTCIASAVSLGVCGPHLPHW